MFVDMFITEVIQSSVKQLSSEIVTEQNASVENQSNANMPMQQSTLPYVESVEGSVNCGKQDPNHQEQKMLQCKTLHQDLNQIARQTYQPSILNLDIMYVKFHSVSLGTACLRTFAKANPGLHMFSIAWKELTDHSFEAVIESERELKTVSLVECEHLYTSSIIKLGISCQHLQNIDLKGVNFIQDPAITALVSSGNVRKLSLAESDITDVALRNIVRYGKDKLEDLDLSWCENITEDGLNEIATACSQLRSLTLRRCPATANTLKLLSENCPLLTSLNLSGIGSMNEDVVISCHWVTRLDLLEQLDLSWNLWVTNDGVSTVLQSCIFLRHLSLGGNKMLTSKPYLPMISDVAKWRRSQAVLRFKIQERRFLQDHPESNTGDSSDEEYEDLFLPHRSTSYASELRYLNLEYCDMVNDIHLGELVAVCRGTLHIVGYYGEAVEPAWIAARMGSLFLAPSGIVV
ncbi:F-box/LRR-repeat protein 2-like [Lingula anatina]|uniref:F-box/LRR-repeat protein 2-like n=1 Tax=Lingula anatina TaxID=7574 RepID=A0A1S3JNT2_LINAN|nr:F-box/LRR-repeat protein 2-like [Lingula anatina]|eukprot:XP_013411634.1 F-box/LRR-repeat protein 2-like [Lingula anatina]